jgi:flagellar biosynthesis protein FlhB
MNSLIFFLGIIIILTILCVYWLIIKVIGHIIHLLDLLIEKSSKNDNVKNNVLSILYFFKDMGPNVSSFAIIAMVVASNESAFQLTLVFILGIILKEISRTLTKKFMFFVGKRGENHE